VLICASVISSLIITISASTVSEAAGGGGAEAETDVELVGGFTALVLVVRVVLVAGAASRRAAAAAVLVTVGRRGAAASLEAGEGALEAILRRTNDVGAEGAGSFFGCGLPAGRLSRPAFSIRSECGLGAESDQCAVRATGDRRQNDQEGVTGKRRRWSGRR
jgi:hypothetical protein